MAKKDYIMIADTETANDGSVVDYAAVIVDRKGNIHAQCAVLVKGVYDARDNTDKELFSDPNSQIDSIWNRKRLQDRYAQYDAMLDSGVRMLASVAAINRWHDKAATQFNPYLTAYNLPFDLDKMQKTGIDCNMFPRRFDLWALAADRWAHSKKYLRFVLANHAFNRPTAKGNMTWKANAETMARFVLGDGNYPDEPHTALEDIIDYELPILIKAIRGRKLADLSSLKSPVWQSMQVKDFFKPA